MCVQNYNLKEATSTHTQLAVIFAGCLFIKDIWDAHSFHNALVPRDGRLQRVKAHRQLCRGRASIDGFPPNHQALGDLVRTWYGLGG